MSEFLTRRDGVVSWKGKGTLCDAYWSRYAYNYGQPVKSLSNSTSFPGDEQKSFPNVIVNSPPIKMVPLVQRCPLPLLTCLTNEYNGISADNILRLGPIFERKETTIRTTHCSVLWTSFVIYQHHRNLRKASKCDISDGMYNLTYVNSEFCISYACKKVYRFCFLFCELHLYVFYCN